MVRNIFTIFAVLALLAAAPTSADTGGSLFVNLTSDESHRADMAMEFSKAMSPRGHAVKSG